MARKPKRISPGDGDPRHGTANGYQNLGCRGPCCRAAWATYYDDLRAKPRSPLPPDDPRHGTSVGYHWWHCKCALCVARNNADSKASYHRRTKGA